jgi:hypothetical protein
MAGATIPARAGTAYSFNNYPAYQNGYTISGTITTDGSTREIFTADITSWTITVYSTGGPLYTLSSAAGNFIDADLEATATTLSVGVPPLRGYPVITRRRKMVSPNGVHTFHRRRSMPRCVSPTPPTSPTRSGPSSSR